MRILTVAACPFPTRQGSQLLIRQSAEALSALGHEVRIATYAGGEEIPCRIPVLRGPRLPGARRLRAGPSLAKPALDAAMLGQVIRLLRAFRPQVIHAHNVEGAFVSVLAARTVPVVYHAHALFEEELPGYFPPALAALAERGGAAADRFVLQRVAAVIALTGAARDAFIAREAPAAKVHLIPPGVVVPAIDREAGKALRARLVRKGEALVVYAGNADAYQGLDTLLDAAALLPVKRPVRFVFALTGGARDLPRAAAARGLSDQVVFLDASWEETASLLAVCDAAVVPRPGPYGFPMKLLNILALGAPAIVHRASAHGLVDGESALLADDARGFARAISVALTDQPRARAIGEAGRRHARKHHGWDDIAPRIEAVLARAAGAS